MAHQTEVGIADQSTERPFTSEPAGAAPGVLGPVVELGQPRVVSGLRPGAVTLWALFGAAWVVFALSGWIQWVFSDNFTPAPRGPDRLSSTHLALIDAYQVFALALLLTMVTIYLVRPLIRTRRLSLDGMLLIGCTFAFFVDPMINIFHDDTFAWNAYAVNMGSWGDYIPGSIGSQNFGEGLLWAWPDYIIFGVVGALIGCRLLAGLHRRYPRMSTLSGFTLFFILFFVLSSLFEIGRVRFELYSYSRTWSGLTLWAGSQYQWPLYEGVLGAAGATAFTYVRWSWITRGSSFVDSGIDRLRLGARGRQVVLLFAVTGFCAATWTALWFIPWSWQSISANSVAKLPSYLRPGA